ncbi:MAG TPA: hypothetical protein VNP93_04140 [Gaiellaceae bacterium]|nr:hypothetical protein [Gaiellaceae bacterium]
MKRLGAVLGLALLLAATGCGGGGGGDEPGARLRLVVPDNNIRTEGVECSGAQPFRHVHRGTPFTVEAQDGTVVAEGELPAGRAENADPSIDWESSRIPTVCVMELELDLPDLPSYRFVLEDSSPLEFDASLLAQDEPVLLVLTG